MSATSILTPSIARRGRSRLLQATASLAMAFAVMLAIAASAGASLTHSQESTFGPFEGLAWLSIDNSGGPNAGSVWASEINFGTFESSVFELNSSGAPTGTKLKVNETPAGSIGFLDLFTFETSTGARVNNSGGAHAGDVYVPDHEHNVVDVFDESGTYLCQITGKTIPSASECAGPTGSATPTNGFTPSAVAIDPSDGQVAVGAAGRIYVFNEAGEYTGQITNAQLTEPQSLAYDSVGNLYVTNGNPFFGGGSALKFNAAGGFVSVFDSQPRVSVAVDLTSNDVYLGTVGGGVFQYSSGGSLISKFGTEAIGLDVSKATRKVYLTDSEGARGVIWSAPIAIPTVQVQAASNVQGTTATLNGQVDPDLANSGTPVQSCKFEYGATTSYGSTALCSPATPYAGSTAVSTNIAGLTESKTYHYRIVASNENGIKSFSSDQTLITKGKPSVESESVSEITRFSAKLAASINPHGAATEYKFEYVAQSQYQVDGFNSAQVSSTGTTGAGEVPQTVSVTISGLSVDTKYHYRVIATNVAGQDVGPDQSFQTVPVAELLGQYAIARLRTATLEADVNPLGLATSCSVEWLSDAAFQLSGYSSATKVPCEPAGLGSGNGVVTPKVQLSGLALSGRYHFRFVISNSSGTIVGADREFATFGIKSFELKLENDSAGPETRAGAAPYQLVSYVTFPDTRLRNNIGSLDGLIKDVLNELPPGLIGNPEALPKCTTQKMEESKCPGDSQVGYFDIGWFYQDNEEVQPHSPVYNITPPKGKAARFGGIINISTGGFVDSGIRTGGDYGISSGATNLTNTVTLRQIKLTVWGVPADPSHNSFRYCAGVAPCASNAEPRRLLRMPTSCTGPLEARAAVTTYAEPDTVYRATEDLPAVTGCNQVEFEPTIQARPTNNVSDSPTGLHVDVAVPQNEDPEGIATADLRDAVVTLPEGLVLNPAGANGLTSCSQAQIDLHGAAPGQCPASAKVGTVEIDSPLVDHPLQGGVYLATPHDNPFDSLVAIYVAVDDEQTGVVIKLAGKVELDPQSGRLKTTFSDSPQLPFNHFRMEFFSGPKASLRTPGACGTYTTESVLTPWSAPDSGPPATPSDSYDISAAPNGQPCAASVANQPNQPSFDAGSTAPVAGAHSPFVVHLNREDGTQGFSKVKLTPPPGLVAKLAGTPYCPEDALADAAAKSGTAEQASPSCPSASEIGTVQVGAGAGPAPYYATGHAYLTGPYKGAPLGMAIVTPAVAGPFDLGTVVVRVALHVDPRTTEITADSDRIPSILQGIPLDIRSVTVKLDKPQFTLNPTSCDPMSVGGELTSLLDSVSPLQSPFQVGDCTSLGFKPKLVTRLFGGTVRNAHPRLQAVLTMPPGSANIARASVTLPHSEFLEQAHIRTICTRVQFAADACPSASIYGKAAAYSPLLDRPLEGPVYLRSSDHALPDLVADLNGQIEVELVGRIDSHKRGIRTTFESVPDAPVSKFVLQMQGGKKGLLVNSTDICRGKHQSVVQFDAHSGKVSDSRPPLKAQCRKGHSRGSHKRGGGHKRSLVPASGRAAAAG